MPPPQQDSRNAPSTVANYVLDSVRQGILTGRYPAGSRLDQRTLAEEHKVSLIPVRESLGRLEAEGLVTIHPHRGAFVEQVSAAELKEIYLVREVLEELATRAAVPNLGRRSLESLGRVIEAMRRATGRGDLDELFDLNRGFHFTIYRESQMPLLLEMIAGLWNRSRLYRRLYTHLAERSEKALEEHLRIYEACRAGEARSAARAVRMNVRHTVDGILEKMGRESR